MSNQKDLEKDIANCTVRKAREKDFQIGETFEAQSAYEELCARIWSEATSYAFGDLKPSCHIKDGVLIVSVAGGYEVRLNISDIVKANEDGSGIVDSTVRFNPLEFLER